MCANCECAGVDGCGEDGLDTEAALARTLGRAGAAAIVAATPKLVS